MGYYGLEHQNPNGTRNADGRYWGRQKRRADPTGAVVVHTAEVPPDYVGVDEGAEKTARYFTHSTRPASYHRIADSDSIVRFLPFDHEAYHDGTGGNRWSVGVSMGTQAHTWGTRPEHDELMLANAAKAIAESARWWASLGTGRDPLDVARWISPSQYRSGQPGMVEHGYLDPGRRSDPWTAHRLKAALRDRLLAHVRDELGHNPPTPEPPKEWDEMATKEEIQEVVREVVQEEVEKLAIGPYKGHQGALPQLSLISREVVGNDGSRTIRQLGENNYNRVKAIYDALFDKGNKLKPVIARFLD